MFVHALTSKSTPVVITGANVTVTADKSHELPSGMNPDKQHSQTRSRLQSGHMHAPDPLIISVGNTIESFALFTMMVGSA